MRPGRIAFAALAPSVFEPMKSVDARILLVVAAALGLVLDLGLVGDAHGDGEDVADLMGALVLEEGARAVAPQRVRIVDGGLRRRHRHVHRLVAGLRLRIFDAGQRRRFADQAQPLERGAAGRRARPTQWRRQSASRWDALDMVCMTFTRRAGRAVGRIMDEATSRWPRSAARAAPTLTRPGPMTVACRTFLDCTLSTLMTSPSAPPSIALPRMVRTMPGTSIGDDHGFVAADELRLHQVGLAQRPGPGAARGGRRGRSPARRGDDGRRISRLRHAAPW